MVKQVFKLVLAAVLLVLILSRIDISRFYVHMKAQDPNLLILAFFSIPIWILLKTLKWKILLQTCIRSLPIFQIMRSFLAGLAIGMITPGKVGELSRAFFIPSESKSRIVGLVLLDRYFDLLLLFILISFGTFHFLGMGWAVVTVLLGFLGTIVLIILQRFVKREDFFKGSNFIMSRLADMLRAAKGMNLFVVLLLFAVSAATMLLSVLTSYCLVLSFVPIPFMAALNVFPIVVMTNIFPITFGNLGVREGATIFLLSTYGVSDEISLNIALSLFFLHTLIPSLLGIILIQMKGMKPGRNNRINNEN